MKKDFLQILTRYNPDEINKFIKENGKEGNKINPFQIGVKNIPITNK